MKKVYVIWESVGRWPVDRGELPIGVFEEADDARAAIKDFPTKLPSGETAEYTIFEVPFGQLGEGRDVDEDSE